MLKKLFKRSKSQKGMSGVLVALLLVVIGVGLVAGINSFLTTNMTNIQQEAQDSINNALK